MILQTWGGVLQTSFQGLWAGVLLFVPKLIVALVIVFIGWGIAYLIGKAISEFLSVIKFDEALRKTGFHKLVERSGLTLNSPKFVSGLFKIGIVIIFLIAAFDILGLNQVTQFLSQVVLIYLPQLIVAVLILLVGVVVGSVLEEVVVASSKTAGVTSASVLGKISKWGVWIFAILVSLSQMGIAGAFIQTIFTGLVVALSLALGLSFGLGGQEAAADIIKKIRHDINNK